jgi:hypothetical protein
LGRGESTRQKEDGRARGHQNTPRRDRAGAARKPKVFCVSHSDADQGAGALISHGKLRVSNTWSRLSWKLMLPVNRSCRSQRKNQ